MLARPDDQSRFLVERVAYGTHAPAVVVFRLCVPVLHVPAQGAGQPSEGLVDGSPFSLLAEAGDARVAAAATRGPVLPQNPRSAGVEERSEPRKHSRPRGHRRGFSTHSRCTTPPLVSSLCLCLRVTSARQTEQGPITAVTQARQPRRSPASRPRALSR